MIVTSTLCSSGGVPTRPEGSRLVASVDVEWTKDYRVTGANRPFCYSIVWLTTAEPGHVTVGSGFDFTSVYVHRHGSTRGLLVESAAVDLGTVLGTADVLVGHQLCSDLGVLAQTDPVPAAITAARHAWATRRRADPGGETPKVVDTRYDTGALLSGVSRRLVDVCMELGLDVTQPELTGTSMTALHRRWIDLGDVEARERITVLNLRHSLSAALVALRLLDATAWTSPLNVNQLLARQLHGRFAWMDHPTFKALL